MPLSLWSFLSLVSLNSLWTSRTLLTSITFFTLRKNKIKHLIWRSSSNTSLCFYTISYSANC